jgi:hypothetical protein
MNFSYDNQQCQNIYHYQNPTSPSDADMIAIAGHFKDWWNTEFKSAMPGALTLRNITCTDLTNFNGNEIVYVTGLPLTGLDVTHNPYPNNVTLAVKWLTGFRGRSFRGRTYHLGMTEDQALRNVMTVAALAFYNNAYGKLLDGTYIPVNHLCITSFRHNNAPRSSASSSLVTGLSIDPTIDSQRRRLPGRGN